MDSSREDTALLQGLVVHKRLDRYDVLCAGRIVPCRLSGALRHEAQTQQQKEHRSADMVTAGDHVRFRAESAPDAAGSPTAGLITEVLPRKNRLGRRAAGPRPVEQVLAANLDVAVLVFAAAEPKPRWTLLDRFLVQAEASEVPALICITKLDLGDPVELERDLKRYRDIGYPIVFTAVPGGPGALGLEDLRERLRGKVSVLVGKSGVGKTTLINALTGSDGLLRTGTVSRSTGKGRHTTSEAQMILLPDGGGIIDTPGLREFGLWQIPAQEVAAHFPEMRGLLEHCRFRGGCSHSHEPGCAVKEAVRDSRIHPERYRSYLRITGQAAEDDQEDDAGGRGSAAKSFPRSGTGHKHSANNERRVAPPPESFVCGHCGVGINAAALGTDHRNHCPQCLWSLHVDQRPGDRAAGCAGAMEPIAVSVRPDGEWMLLHRCRECGVIKSNRIAGDDNGLLLISLAARPLARPPFPLDRIPAGGGIG